MKFSNSVKTVVFILNICVIVPYSYADSYDANANIDESIQEVITPQNIYAFAEKRQDIFENILKQILHTLEQTDIVLEDLALEVHNNVIKTDNKQALIESIKTSRALIQQLKSNAFVEIDELKLHILQQFTQSFLTYLKTALNNGFATLPPFDISQMRNRPIDNEIEVADLYQGVNHNNELLTQVQKLSKEAGLTWYNKQYARLDRYVIQPCQKYKIPKRFAQLSALSSVGLYMWYQSQSENPFLRKIFGYSPRIVSGELDLTYHNGGIAIPEQRSFFWRQEPIIIPPKPLKVLGYLDYFLIQTNSGSMPLLGVTVPLFVASLKDELNVLKKEISKKVTRSINFLKGGQHRLQGDGITRMEPTTTFDDLVGLDHAKRIGRFIVKYLEDSERFARKKLTPEKGYLLYGKTRTGKSEFAKALCGEIKELTKRMGWNQDEFKFYDIKTSLIIEKGIGYIMELAQQCGPCVLFIDEVDLLGLQRVGGNPAMLSEFLSCMSGVMDSDPKKQVIILAATNNPENIDTSMRQRGRFGKTIYFDYPSFEHRKEFLMRRLCDLSVNIDFFDIEKLAYETNDCSYEDLNAMIKGALQKSKLLGIALTQEQLEHSLDEEVRNILMVDDKQVTAQEQEFIAAYQAGTVLAHCLLNTKSIVAKTTIRPVIPKLKEEGVWEKYGENRKEQAPIEYGKTFVYKQNDALNLSSAQDVIAECKVLLAGNMAQTVLLDNENTNYRPYDKQKAWSLVKNLVFGAIDPDQMATEQKNKLLEKTRAEFARYEQEIKELLMQNKATLQALSKKLQEKFSLSGKEIQEIMYQLDQGAADIPLQ